MFLFPVPLIAVGVSADAETAAWVAAVFAVDATVVGGARQTLVNNLIVGLKNDGVWSKLDRLFLFAAATATEARVDIVAAQLATAVNSPTFTTDRGYTGIPANLTYIDSNFAPSTATTPKMVHGDGCIFGWSNTAGADHGAMVGINGHTRIIPQYDGDNLAYYCIFGGDVTVSNNPAATGLYLVQESGSFEEYVLDINGSQFSTGNGGDSGVESGNVVALAHSAVPAAMTAREVSCLGFGGALSSGERVAIYTRLRTYMTAVGVP